MRLPEFDFLEPRSVDEARVMLAQDPEGSVVFAGGTDILVSLREGGVDHRRLVSLHRIDGLDAVEVSAEGGLSIGAMATVNRVARHDGVRESFPGVVDAALGLAADQVRNVATVAGNLCNAVPSADMAPILLAHDATLRVASDGGERTIPLREFFTGPRRTVLSPTDVVLSIDVAPPEPGSGAACVRQGGRVALSLPVASVGAVVTMDGGTCREASVALGAVAPTPLLATSVAEHLAGKPLSSDVLAEAGELASSETKPIGDVRSSKAYRLEAVKVLTRRALSIAAGRAGDRGR
jgi:carbon-monoxide dehydrogenase medium subunit